MDLRIQVFAKAPIPGRVKTRLAVRLGRRGAAQLQSWLIECALRTAAAAGIGTLELWCTPNCEHPFLRDCARRYAAKLIEQGSGDLGSRMHRALKAAIDGGGAGVLIGSDCPSLMPADLLAAAGALEAGCDVVLSPAEDGGYVLVAARRAPPALFDGIQWGGPAVMAQTRERLLRLGLRWRELAPRWDVDRPEDYDRLLREGWLPDAEVGS
ncbi:MAG TPA: TIGR04282 family arsenosugar biosynthesis glycosyltransferase [Burkholderiales bacterium]|nr:TIGR04282 family arsenosugar biosynthesis glycosyltransferase [Burkholderiales bacterium]